MHHLMMMLMQATFMQTVAEIPRRSRRNSGRGRDGDGHFRVNRDRDRDRFHVDNKLVRRAARGK